MAGTEVTSKVTAIISVVDKATAPIQAIVKKLDTLGARGRLMRSQWAGLAERTGLTKLAGLFGGITHAASDMAKSIWRAGLEFAGLGAIGGAAGGILVVKNAIEQFTEQGERLGRMHDQLGLNIKDLQAWEHAAFMANVPIESFDAGVTKLNKTLATVAAGKNKEATKLIGFLQARGAWPTHQVRQVSEALPLLAGAFARIPNAASRTRLAMAMFGRAGAALIPMLMKGKEGLAEAQKWLASHGGMSDAAAKKAEELAKSQKLLSESIRLVKEQLGATIAPYLTPLLDRLTKWLSDNDKLIRTEMHVWVFKVARAIKELWGEAKHVDWSAWADTAKQVVDVLKQISTALGGVNKLIEYFVGFLVVAPILDFFGALVTLAAGLGLVDGALGLISVTLSALAGPWGIVALLVVGLATVIYKNWDAIKAKTIAVWNTLTTTIDAAIGTVKDAVQGVWAWLRGDTNETWAAVLKAVVDAWTKITSAVDASGKALDATLTALGERLMNSPFGKFFSWIAGQVGLVGAAAGAAGGAAGAGGVGGAVAGAAIAGFTPAAPGAARGAKGAGPFATPAGVPANGTVNVNVNMSNAPPGTRISTATQGKGVKAQSFVAWSMPQLQGAQ